MGCAVSVNNTIKSTKKENDENLLYHIINSNRKFKYSNSNIINEDNIKENNKINYVNHSELKNENMLKIKSKYIIVEQISNTNFSTDYKLQLKSNLSKYKTLKIIRKKIIGDENKILNEIQSINSLNHENLFKIEECYYDSINYYFIMEYCILGKLSDLLKQKKIFSENQVKFIIYQLLDVDSYLLENDLIHTDINPNNILIESSFKYNNEDLYLIKLLNFASSTYMKEINKSENNSNNLPFYVSPEIFDNQYNLNSDIWSIGIIMYEMLFGFIPFYGDNFEKVKYIIKNSNINFQHDNISNEALNLLKNMLIRDPTHRYNINECIFHPWFYNINELLSNRNNNNYIENSKEKNENINTNISKNKQNNFFKININQFPINENEKNEITKKPFNTIIKDFNFLESRMSSSKKITTKRNKNNNENYYIKNMIYHSLKYIHHYFRKKYHLTEEMEYLKDLFDKYKINEEINIENTIICFNKYCGYNNSLINELIIGDIINDKLKNEMTNKVFNLIQFQNFLIKEKENDINKKLCNSFSHLKKTNKYEIIKSFNEIKPNSKFKKYFEEMKKEMNEDILKENYLFCDYKNLIEKVVDKIENEKIEFN